MEERGAGQGRAGKVRWRAGRRASMQAVHGGSAGLSRGARIVCGSRAGKGQAGGRQLGGPAATEESLTPCQQAPSLAAWLSSHAQLHSTHSAQHTA